VVLLLPESLLMRIAVDITSIVSGERAIRRNSRVLATEILRQASDIEYVLFYVDRRDRSDLRISIPPGSPHRERVIRMPGAIVSRLWKTFSWPTIESLAGPVDLVFATDFPFPPSRKAVVASTIHGIAYISVPDLLPPAHRAGLRRSLAYAMRESDYFVAVSEYTRREVMDHLGIAGDRIRVCPNAVDPIFRPMEDRSLLKKVLEDRFGIRGRYLIYVGAITHRKNVLRTIEAFARLRDRHPDRSLVLVGPEENAAEEARALVARSGLGGAVRFLGPVPTESDDLVYLYSGADLLLYPSLHEGWTGPPIEAMACGTPVVASNVSSLPESCGGAALLVDPLETEAISGAAIRVLEEPGLREDLVEKGLRRAAACTWSRSAEILQGIFRDLVALGRRR
jgi:glycosyltransferase involved in cell wall biosynthesis